jgi:hypothetical protein
MKDGMVVVRVPLGSLALKYYKAWREYRDAEDQLETLILALYGSNRFEVGPDGIDVYEAQPSDASALAVFRAGFRSVRVHEHKRDRFLKCSCRIDRDLLGGST